MLAKKAQQQPVIRMFPKSSPVPSLVTSGRLFSFHGGSRTAIVGGHGQPSSRMRMWLPIRTSVRGCGFTRPGWKAGRELTVATSATALQEER